MESEEKKPLVQFNLDVPKSWEIPLARIFDIIGDPLAESSEILTDWLKYRRLKNLVSISKKLKLLNISDSEIQSTQHALSINQNLKLIEYSSMADDEYLQQKWANLIANASQGADFHNLYSELLNSLEPVDAYLLDCLVNKPNHNGYKLSDIEKLVNQKDRNIRISLANLERMGLINSGKTVHSGGKMLGVITGKESEKTRYLVTGLGVHLKEICETNSRTSRRS